MNGWVVIGCGVGVLLSDLLLHSSTGAIALGFVVTGCVLLRRES